MASIVGHSVESALQLRCWGDFALSDDAGQTELHISRRKTRALLAFLALHPDKPISRERLIGLLWGDRAEEQARGSLRQAIFELKAVAPALRDAIQATREQLSLRGDALVTDIDSLARHTAAADYPKLIALIPERHDRLFGNLDGIDEGFDEWLAIERTRRRDEVMTLIADASAAALATGQTRAARLLHARLQELDQDGDPIAAPGPVRPVPAEPARYGHTSPGRFFAWRRWVGVGLAVLVLLGLVLGSWLYLKPRAIAPVSMAVLPLKNLTPGGDGYFADGVSEEILGQLSNNAGLKVLGRTSAWSFRDQVLDAPTLGRKLAVDYLIEGSIRTAGNNVRINVSLVRTRDGAQLWAERFDGTLDDVFAFQDRIGHAVSARLSNGPVPAQRFAARATRGDVYGLYLTARGLIRDREEARMDSAIELLRRAVTLDPQFAPAQASLGAALHLRLLTFRDRPDPAMRREALAYIRRAIALDPELAEGHYALGLAILPAGAAKAHIERAVRLDPNNAEFWTLLAQVNARDGSHEAALNAWRRAVAIDPLWWQAFYFAAEMAWDMGHQAESIGYVRRIERDGTPLPFQAHMVRGDLAWRRNDVSGEFASARAAFAVADSGKKMFSELGMGRALRAAGLYDQARPLWRHYRLDDQMWRMWRGGAPAPEQVRAISPDPASTWDDLPVIHFTLRTLLIAGRYAEVVSLFDRSFQSPEAFAAEPHVSHHELLVTAPLFAMALAQTGRQPEAGQLLAVAEAAMLRRLRQGRVPLWYHANCAKVWAVGGNRAAALAALERSVSLGWTYNKSVDSFADIGDEPAYRSLRGDPRFERIRAGFKAHTARERAEIRQIMTAPDELTIS